MSSFVKWMRLQMKTKKHNLDDLETVKEYSERWRSIYVIYFTMFLISLGFTITLTGVWPYLDKLDPTAGKEFLGYVVAANPLAQMIFSPLVGWWSNKLGSIRAPLLTSLVLFAISNVIYSFLELFTDHRKYWMLWSRFFVGISSANIAACRSYLSAATTVSERTKAVSMISLAQVLGFIFGPALQAAVVPFGDEGVWLIPNKLKLNMYTAAGWINVILAIINIIIFLPFIFKEHRIAAKEAMRKQGVNTEKETYKGKKIDILSAWTLIIAFFVLVFNFMLLETLATSLTMDQFAWTKEEAIYYMGIVMTVGGVLAIFTFASIAPLCNRFPEVKVMIWFGFFFMVLGRVVYIPWGDGPPIVYDEELKFQMLDAKANCGNYNQTILKMNFTEVVHNNQTFNFTNDGNATNGELRQLWNSCPNITEFVGCPSSQEWCKTTRKMTIAQFILGFVLTSLGYPIGVTLIQTIFSKILGARPQGVWMGLMTGAGCLSRVLGPVFVTFIYTEFGTNWTFGMTTVMMIVSIVWLLLFEKRLITEDQSLKEESVGTELEEINTLVEKPQEGPNHNGDSKR